MTGACCPRNDDGVTQLSLGAGPTVGVRGLNSVFEQLWALGRNPEQAADAELVGMVRAQKNYIPAQADVEARYAAALRRAYAAFCARRHR